MCGLGRHDDAVVEHVQPLLRDTATWGTLALITHLASSSAVHLDDLSFGNDACMRPDLNGGAKSNVRFFQDAAVLATPAAGAHPPRHVTWAASGAEAVVGRRRRKNLHLGRCRRGIPDAGVAQARRLDVHMIQHLQPLMLFLLHCLKLLLLLALEATAAHLPLRVALLTLQDHDPGLHNRFTPVAHASFGRHHRLQLVVPPVATAPLPEAAVVRLHVVGVDDFELRHDLLVQLHVDAIDDIGEDHDGGLHASDLAIVNNQHELHDRNHIEEQVAQQRVAPDLHWPLLAAHNADDALDEQDIDDRAPDYKANAALGAHQEGRDERGDQFGHGTAHGQERHTGGIF
mmetsp:Transcript_112329/g.324474  ORF Transcript_112329/g.324474 Transcript_112329/m.324474 type:complete len:344 (+) Transcript_112329:867-1898(+)